MQINKYLSLNNKKFLETSSLIAMYKRQNNSNSSPIQVKMTKS